MVIDAIDIDANWKEFLRTKIDSFTRWDILHYFYSYPGAGKTADEISQQIARDIKVVTVALNGLVKSNVLSAEMGKNGKIYRLASDPEVRLQINQFMEACRNREFRMKAIRQVLSHR
jgi:hypothetical protein